VVETYTITTNYYHVEFKDIEERGLWSMSVSFQACGIEKAIDYSGALNVSNRLLKRPVLVTTMPKAGAKTLVSLDDLRLGEGESYRLDLDNGSLTQWKAWNEGDAIQQVEYEEPGIYNVKVMVRAADGNSTGWSAPVVIDVAEADAEGTDIAGPGRVTALILVMFLFATILVWSMMRSFR
jgi:hypothetical protein